MREFWVYTGLRIALFLGALGVVAGAWMLATGDVPLFWAVVLAFVISGIGSYVVLGRQREAFARRVDQRARRASEAFEARRAREDAD